MPSFISTPSCALRECHKALSQPGPGFVVCRAFICSSHNAVTVGTNIKMNYRQSKDLDAEKKGAEEQNWSLADVNSDGDNRSWKHWHPFVKTSSFNVLLNYATGRSAYWNYGIQSIPSFKLHSVAVSFLFLNLKLARHLVMNCFYLALWFINTARKKRSPAHIQYSFNRPQSGIMTKNVAWGFMGIKSNDG